ncbi:MAG TPA: NADH-quinone oxidoreductase subunit M [Chitinophagaceae bacterium]|nr:NADH-quinone oxidoreductase subunit M [Chitinophagaceae bacterium]
MIPVLFILVPLLTGVAAFLIKEEKYAKGWAIVSSLVTLVVSLIGLAMFNKSGTLQFTAEWLPALGSKFALKADGMSQMLCLLTALAFPIIFIATYKNHYKNPSSFYALMLLSQAGLMGVFIAADALLFYFFWELALIPVYFLCSIWGGERRIAVTFKFFIYTFVGSLLMLVGLIYLYLQTPGQSFALEAFYALDLDKDKQQLVFWLLFLAFAIKMPIFPFHTWQPDTYEQSPTAVTMVLSGIMVKMGVFGLIRWVVPVVPLGSWIYGDRISIIAIISILYASLIAIKQDDLKRFVAYSSIAHIGLMCLAIFATNSSSMQGVMIQMFNHGINIIGLWIVVDLIEQRYGTRKMSQLGGLAKQAPSLAILLVIVALANVALPLTNAFVGEFMMFNGIFSSPATEFGWIFAAVAGLSVIFSAWYTLNMIQRVFYGSGQTALAGVQGIGLNAKLAMVVLVIIIVVIGVYPSLLLDVTRSTSDFILSKMFTK